MKFTRENLKAIIKEELNKIIDEGMPVGSAKLFANTAIVILQDGTFNVDVLVDTDLKDPTQGKAAHAITGRLDEDSLDYLIEMGVIRPVGGAPAASEDDFPSIEAWSKSLKDKI